MKSRMCINLRNCQYDLFRNIALEELGWRVVDYRNRVIEGVPPPAKEEAKENADDNEQNESKSQNEDEEQEDSDKEFVPKQAAWRNVNDHNPDAWDIFWADSGMTPEFLGSLSNTQRVNHYLGMYNICRKSTLGMHLKRFQKEFPDHYDFFPQTWMYPAEFHDIQEYQKKKTQKRKEKIDEGRMTEAQSEQDPIVLYICKPESGSQGRGIFIATKVEEMRVQLNQTYEQNRKKMNEYLKIEQGIDTMQAYSHPTTQQQRDALLAREIEKPQNQYIVQKYIKRPALYNGHKYDFRIYVLITSVISPMTIFLYNDGLVRLATEKYDPSKSFDDPFVHLTNYSLNKNNTEFDSTKHKLRLKDVLRGEMISQSNGKTYRKNAKQIWHEIEQIVIKTVFVVQPQLQHLYRTSQAKEPDLCCDLLGFDVMLDHKLKPWMLEVNHMPSFRADTKIDHDVKHDLIKNTLQILQLSIEQRRQQEVILKQEQKLAMQYGNVKRMTVKEHSERVRFDHNLIQQYIPGNRYKRIFPVDPGCGGYATNGDELEDVYAKLEKSATNVWKKQVGMIQKKEVNPNIHDQDKKKKRRKGKKGVLTSMTSHIVDKTAKAQMEQQDIYDEQEEGPEDGIDEEEALGEIEEENPEGRKNVDSAYNKNRRDSAMSNHEEQKGGGDLSHIINGQNRRSNLLSYQNKNGIQGQNQSQSSLSKNSSQRNSHNLHTKQSNANNTHGQGNSNFNTFVPLSEFQIPTQQFKNNVQSNFYNLNSQNRAIKKNQELASKSIQEELKNLPQHHPVPTLNEILTQLHQDPGFRQRYKEYCRAVLDGRFSFGGIKNPIYDHIYGGDGQRGQAQGIPAGQKYSLTGQGVTLLANNQNNNQRNMNAMYGPQKTRQKLETIPHANGSQQTQQSSAGPTISEAAYFIQRVNRILQNQGSDGQQAPPQHGHSGSQGGGSYANSFQNAQHNANAAQSGIYNNYCQTNNPTSNSYNFNFTNNMPQSINQTGQYSSASQMTQYMASAAAAGQASQQAHQGMVGSNHPYLGLAIQSVSASPNNTGGQGSAQINSAGNGVSSHPSSYVHTLKQIQLHHQQMAHAAAQQAQKNTSNSLSQHQRSSFYSGGNSNLNINTSGMVQQQHQAQAQHRQTFNATGTNFNISQKMMNKKQQAQSAQKTITKIQNLQNNSGGMNQGQVTKSGIVGGNPSGTQSSQGHNNSFPQQQQKQLQIQQQNSSTNVTNPTASQNQTNGGVQQKTVINLLKTTMPSQNPSKKSNIHSLSGVSNTAAIVPLTYQQQQILSNLSSNQQKQIEKQVQGNQYTTRGIYNNNSAPQGQDSALSGGHQLNTTDSKNVILSTQLYKKQQTSSFHIPEQHVMGAQKLSQASATHAAHINANSSLSNQPKNLIQNSATSQMTPPFNGSSKRPTFEQQINKRSIQIRGEYQMPPDANGPSSPGLAQKITNNQRKMRTGAGPIKALGMSAQGQLGNNPQGTMQLNQLNSVAPVGPDLTQSMGSNSAHASITKINKKFDHILGQQQSGGNHRRDYPSISRAQIQNGIQQNEQSYGASVGSKGSSKRAVKYANYSDVAANPGQSVRN